jgi:hypothetical protein
MSSVLAPIDFCRTAAGLGPHELLLGVTPGGRHERLLQKYRSPRRSPAMARARIVADLRAALARGETGEAADLLVALRRLLAMDARPAQVVHSRYARRKVMMRRENCQLGQIRPEKRSLF